MTHQEMIEARESYFNRYRRLITRMEDTRQSMRECQESFEREYQLLRDQNRSIAEELTTMRKVITTMIEHDIDPTMAKLKLDENVISDIWQGRTGATEFDGPFHGMGSLATHLTVTGSSSSPLGSYGTGAMGPMGAISTSTGYSLPWSIDFAGSTDDNDSHGTS